MNIVCSPVLKLNWGRGLRTYSALQRIKGFAQESFQRHLVGMDEFRWMDAPRYFETPSAMFRHIFLEVRKIWEQGNNVLFVDADSLCIRHTEVFGLYDNFRVFATTGDTSRFKDQFPEYLLSGVRYFPSTLSREVWDVGERQWEKFAVEIDTNPLWIAVDRWDYEQYIYNLMFYSQPGIRENYKSLLNQKMNYFYKLPDPQEANILAYNASAMGSRLVREMRRDYFRYRICP
jgi:hypothetical protein